MNRDQLWSMLLSLLDYSSPAGYERGVLGPILPKNGKWDKKDNYIVTLGESSTLFACHLDTVGKNIERTNPYYDPKRHILYTNDSSLSCLGGDDRCGILTMLALIEANVPGTYIFHSAEEVGMLGARHILQTLDLTKFARAIEFDRKGTNSIISNIMSHDVCSKVFVKALAKEIDLNFVDDPTGLITDVELYSNCIPEVTNLSVGYEKAHSSREYINVLWLIDHFIPHILRVNWESLPIGRDLDHIYDDFDLSEIDYDDDQICWGVCEVCGTHDFLHVGITNLCDDCNSFHQYMEDQLMERENFNY